MAGFAVKEKRAGKDSDSPVNKGFIRRENRTGIPTQLKESMEQSTGLSLDDVRVHYNSGLPAKLDALAYTKGNQVEIGPGQERHLPHELGHVIQQKLGLVWANARHSSGAALNTDARLERQADEIGAGKRVAIVQRMGDNVIQREGGDSGAGERPNAGRQGATAEEIRAAKASLPAKIEEVRNNMKRQEKKRTTFAVAIVKLNTGEIKTWITGAGRRPRIRRQLRGEDMEPKKNSVENGSHDNRLNDAEQTMIREANRVNAEILAIGATRKMCSKCQEAARENGILDRVVTELKEQGG